jgi:hypothetical protein
MPASFSRAHGAAALPSAEGRADPLLPSILPRVAADGAAKATRISRLDACAGEKTMDCSWVVTIAGEVVAAVGLCYEGQYVARVCAFRVHPEWQHTSAVTKLLDCIRNHCWARGFLRVLLESCAAPRWLLSSMQRRGFQFAGRTRVAGKDTFAFDVDLYYSSPPKC